MTPAQRLRLYFPRWHAGYKTNWHRVDGSLVRKDGRRSDILDRVEDLASELARQHGRQVTADDLRHGCHVLATGRDCSSDNLGNEQLDRVLVVFRLLADPDDLSARIAMDHPEKDARRRLEWAVRNCGLPEAYVRAVCSSKFGTKDWCGLEDAPLRQLMITLKSRVKVRQAAATEPEPAVTASCPF